MESASSTPILATLKTKQTPTAKVLVANSMSQWMRCERQPSESGLSNSKTLTLVWDLDLGLESNVLEESKLRVIM